MGVAIASDPRLLTASPLEIVQLPEGFVHIGPAFRFPSLKLSSTTVEDKEMDPGMLNSVVLLKVPSSKSPATVQVLKASFERGWRSALNLFGIFSEILIVLSPSKAYIPSGPKKY